MRGKSPRNGRTGQGNPGKGKENQSKGGKLAPAPPNKIFLLGSVEKKTTRRWRKGNEEKMSSAFEVKG